MRDDGGDKRAITDADHYDDEPAWSPDGRSIAYVRTGGESMGDVWLVDADGANARPLMANDPPFEQRSPAWSPDGALIAFTSAHEIIGPRSGDYQLYTVRADGTELTRRTSSPVDKRHPAWLSR
jgi:Tol biopolymer transport system component